MQECFWRRNCPRVWLHLKQSPCFVVMFCSYVLGRRNSVLKVLLYRRELTLSFFSLLDYLKFSCAPWKMSSSSCLCLLVLATSPGQQCLPWRGGKHCHQRYFNSHGIQWVGERRMMMANNRTIPFIPCLCSEWAFVRPHVHTQAFFVLVLIINRVHSSE